MAVSYVDWHNLSRGADIPSPARVLLGGGSALCGSCPCCLGSRPVLVVVEVGVVGAPEGNLCCGRIDDG